MKKNIIFSSRLISISTIVLSSTWNSLLLLKFDDHIPPEPINAEFEPESCSAADSSCCSREC
jgi:hypothetical protein